MVGFSAVTKGSVAFYNLSLEASKRSRGGAGGDRFNEHAWITKLV